MHSLSYKEQVDLRPFFVRLAGDMTTIFRVAEVRQLRRVFDQVSLGC